MDYLKAFLKGSTGELRLASSPSAQAESNLRRLDTLGLLTSEMVWELMAQVDVDPLFLIRTLRAHKKELGFVAEEHHIGDSLAFLAGDKTPEGYKVAYHVNVFTNDVICMVREKEGYKEHSRLYAEPFFKNTLFPLTAGKDRLAAVLEQVRGQVNHALTGHINPADP